jgi:hypothetical protein
MPQRLLIPIMRATIRAVPGGVPLAMSVGFRGLVGHLGSSFTGFSTTGGISGVRSELVSAFSRKLS